MNQLPVFFGALNYEFRMQARRPALWITMVLLAVLITGAGGAFRELLTYQISSIPLVEMVVRWTVRMNFIFPVGVGVLLADRLPRDRRTKVEELFWSTPGALSARLMGKYFGSMLAALIPVMVFYVIGTGCILYHTQDLMTLPLALAAFAAIVLPGMLFISAFSIACPAILWVPLYQFLYTGYWFWGNMLGPRVGIPTLSETILTPAGGYMAAGFFEVPAFQIFDFRVTALQGMESLSLLLSITVLVMVVLWRLLKWQQVRQ